MYTVALGLLRIYCQSLNLIPVPSPQILCIQMMELKSHVRPLYYMTHTCLIQAPSQSSFVIRVFIGKPDRVVAKYLNSTSPSISAHKKLNPGP